MGSQMTYTDIIRQKEAEKIRDKLDEYYRTSCPKLFNEVARMQDEFQDMFGECWALSLKRVAIAI